MAVYTWTGTGWFDNSTGTSGGAPGPGDTIFFPAGVADDTVLSPGNIAGGPDIPYANIFINSGASVDLGTLSSIDASSYDHFSVTNLFIGTKATLNLLGSIEGHPAAEGMNATNVFLGSGALLNTGNTYLPSPDGPTTIDNLFNSGGTLISTDSLQLGGPGFVQTYGFYPAESELNDGHGHTIINLGTLVQGSVPFYVAQGGAAMVVSANNATLSDVLTGLTNGGFTWTYSANPSGPTESGIPQGPGVGPGALVNVSTATLGAHSLILSLNGPTTHDTLVITDRVVAA